MRILIVFRIPFATNHVHRRDLKVSESYLVSELVWLITRSYQHVYRRYKLQSLTGYLGRMIFDQRPYVEM